MRRCSYPRSVPDLRELSFETTVQTPVPPRPKRSLPPTPVPLLSRLLTSLSIPGQAHCLCSQPPRTQLRSARNCAQSLRGVGESHRFCHTPQHHVCLEFEINSRSGSSDQNIPHQLRLASEPYNRALSMPSTSTQGRAHAAAV